MTRKASIHFKPVNNIAFAVSHSERTELYKNPSYLLPVEHRLPNSVVTGSLPELELNNLFIHQKAGMSRQAKTAGSSPFWEGVVVLSDTDAEAQAAYLLEWKKEYEKATGHKVLHMSIHMDEGYVGTDGMPVYNPHAHVIVTRMDSKNKVIHLGRKQLAEVQDLTAIALKMQRGSTLAERGGKRGRAHIGHREFRAQADEARLNLDAELGQEKERGDFFERSIESQQMQSMADRAKLKTAEATISAQAQEIGTLKEQYRLDREDMKASGEATQKDYTDRKKILEAKLEALKKAHEATLAELKKANQTINDQAGEIAQLKAKLTQTHVPAPVHAGPRPPVDQSKVQAIKNPGQFSTGGEFIKALEKAARDQSRHWDDIDWVKVEGDAARRLTEQSGYQPDYIFSRLAALSPAQQGLDGDVERLRRECRPLPPENQPTRPDDNDFKP